MSHRKAVREVRGESLEDRENQKGKLWRWCRNPTQGQRGETEDVSELSDSGKESGGGGGVEN